MKVYPKRVFIDNLWHIILYDEYSNPVFRSEGIEEDHTIRLVWEGLEFISIPEHEIYVTFSSIIKTFY